MLRWLAAAPGGQGGAWWEFYGTRATPPLPPIGLVVWTWAELVMFIVQDVLGVRPQPGELVLAPHLLSGVDHLRATLPIRGGLTTLVLQRTAGEPLAIVDGQRLRPTNGVYMLPHTSAARQIECHVR